MKGQPIPPPEPEYRLRRLTHKFEYDQFTDSVHPACLEIIYLRQGMAAIEVDGLHLNARGGALIIISPDAPHSGRYAASDRSGKFERYTIELENLPVSRLLPAGCSPVVQLDISNILTAMFQLLEREYLVRDAEWETVCNGILTALFTLIRRSAAPAAEPVPTQTLAADILAYLHAHYCENISLQSVADHFYISHYYLSHLMKKHLNIPLMQYVIHLRISEAQTLLRDTDYPIRQIAQMVGYPNINYFSNVFKKTTGSAPGEYRARGRD